MSQVVVSPGSIPRLRRIQKLKGYTEQQALDFCISLGWLTAEKQSKTTNTRKIIEEKESRGDSS
jgi:hypothetical protein